MNLAELLSERGSEIVGLFVAELQRQALSPPGLGKSLLVDHIPEFLTEIGRALGGGDLRPSQDGSDASATGRRHGAQRWQLAFDLQAVVREYGILRHAIYACSNQYGVTIDSAEADALGKCLNVGVAEAVAEYVEQRDAEHARQTAEHFARLESTNRAKDEFVAVVSHELRTPLNAIIGWVRLLRAGSLTEERSRHALSVVERNADNLGQLVSDLLDVSRITTGRIRLNPAQLDLASVVEICVEEARLALEAKRIALTVELDRERSVLRGDADRLQQVVWALLTNAVKFTAKDGTITLRLRRIESDIELVVRDDGAGIAPEFLPRVFESFQQSDSTVTRRHGGLGIGLSIAKHLVDLHGGSLTAESEGLGRGATFTVRLPVSPLISPTLGVTRVGSQTPSRGVALSTPDLSGLRALVVDDDGDARELISTVLETFGVVVVTAGSAREALAELERGPVPDVVISDVGMPEMDGYALVRAVRRLSNPLAAAVPVIALTAFVRAEDRERALGEGFQAHVTKPVELAELLARVGELAGRGPAS